MAFADIIRQVVLTAVRALGESVTHEAAASGVQTTCDCVLTRRSDPILVGGQITVVEDHFQAVVPLAQMSAEPQINDTLTTADGTVYRVESPATRQEGSWELIVRRLPA